MAFFVLGVSLICVIAGFLIADRLGLFLGFLIALAITLLSFRFGDRDLLPLFEHLKLVGRDPWGLLDSVEGSCHRVGLAMPDVYLVESNSPFVFFLDHLWRKPVVGISHQTLKICDRQEWESLLAEAVWQLKKRETTYLQIIHLAVNSMTGFAQLFDQSINRVFRTNKKRPVVAIYGLFAPFIHFLLRISRHHLYFVCDTSASLSAEDSRSLARALWKLESFCMARPLELPPCSGHLFVCSPNPKPGWWRLQPTIAKRIKRLTGTYPL